MNLQLISQTVKNYLVSFVLLFIAVSASNAQTKKTFSKDHYIELQKLRAAVETDPNNLKTHELFITTWGSDSSLLRQYDVWIKRYPKSPNVPFAIGKELEGHESTDAKRYLLRAVEIDPKFTEAWELLGFDAFTRGDLNAEIEYLKKATDLEPLNPEYAYAYAGSFEETDTAAYHALSLDFIKKFPGNKRCTQILYWLAYRSVNVTERIAFYETILKNYSKKDSWAGYAMEEYFALMLGRDANKALEIAQVTNVPARIKLANEFITVNKLLEGGKPGEAEDTIKSVKVIYRGTEETLALLKARAADAAGHTLSAYNELVTLYSKMPGDILQSTLLMYARKLGINNLQVSGKIRQLRDSTAEQATDFALEGYLKPGKLSLANYKGKVILLTYWFPGCGPCRNEFPHFEAILKKLKDSNVVYLGLNLEPSQNELVVPFLKSTRVSFVPLHDDWHREKGNLKADGAPTNYLIDQSGRIIFKDFRINEHNERMLELMISELSHPEKREALHIDSTQIKK